MAKAANSFRFAIKGLKNVWIEENNFRLEIVLGSIVLAFAAYFHFSSIEIAFLVVSVFAVLAAEVVNTALEDLCDKVESNEDKVIGKIKDISSAFVLLSITGSVVIGIFVLISHFGKF